MKQPDNLFYFALLAIKSFMSQPANIFDLQIENTYCVFLENKFQQQELRFSLRKVILVERRNTTFRAFGVKTISAVTPYLSILSISNVLEIHLFQKNT